jgi:outer membrane receptor protein involved in Fe transport
MSLTMASGRLAAANRIHQRPPQRAFSKAATLMRSSRFQLRASMLVLTSAALAPAVAQAQTAPAQPAPRTPTPGAPPADRSNELVVQGTRSDVIASPDRLSFSVANDLNVQTGTVADALRAVPGVEVDLQGRVSLRGDPGVTILIDGRPSAMMRGDARGDVLMSMSAGQIERVEVITNPSAAFSPEGSGGIINLVTKPVRAGSRSATVRATLGTEGRGGLNASGAYSKPGITMAGELGYRRFTGDASITQDRARLDPGSGNFVTSRLDAALDNVSAARTGRFSIDYDPDKQNRLSSELSYRDARMDATRTESFVGGASAYERDSDIEMRNRGLGFRGSWRRTLPGKDHELVADVEIERGRLRRGVEGVTTISAPATTTSFERIRNAIDRGDYGVKVDYKRPAGEDRSLNLGYEYDLTRADFDYVGARGASFDTLLPVPSLTNRFDYEQAVHAWYGTYQLNLDRLEVQAGLRVEQVEIDLDQVTDGVRAANDYLRAYPTLHLGYGIAANQRLRGSYSRRIQRPSPQDLNPYTIYLDPQNVRRGNPDLRPEVTDSFELAWQLRDGGTFYSVTGFYRRSRGGVTDVVEDLGTGVFRTTRANLAAGQRGGVELIANGKFSKTLTYNASATLLWNEIDARQTGVPEPRSGTTGTVRVSLNWQPTPKDYFQASGNYAGRQLIAQGYRRSGGIFNLGYRRKFNDRFSLVLTGQNVLDSAKQVTMVDTPLLRERVTQRGPGRIVLVGLTYNFGNQGGRRRQEPGFDFDQGAGAVPQ